MDSSLIATQQRERLAAQLRELTDHRRWFMSHPGADDRQWMLSCINRQIRLTKRAILTIDNRVDFREGL